MEQDFEFNDSQEIKDMISKFEEVISSGNEPYFDIEEFEEIIDYYESNQDLKSLNRALETASLIHPYHNYFKLKRAQILARNEKFSQAIKLLENILQSEPNYYFARQNLAYIYSQQGDSKKAIEIYLDSIERGGDLRDIWLSIAMEYENLGKFEIAISYLKKILKRFPEEESALYEALFCYESIGNMEESVIFYQKFTEEHPYSAAAWFNLGISFSNLELFEKAIDAFDFVVAIEEHYSSAYFNKGSALMNLERYHEAIESFRITFEYEPEDSITYLYIARCYENIDALDEAVRNYFKSIELNDKQWEAWAGIGIIYHQLGENYKAIGFMEEANSIKNNHPEILLPFTAVLIDLEKYNQANKLISNLLHDDESNVYAWYMIAEINILNEDFNQANKHLDKALELYPEDKRLKFIKAELMFLMQKNKEALKYLFDLDIHSIEEMNMLKADPEILNSFLQNSNED